MTAWKLLYKQKCQASYCNRRKIGISLFLTTKRMSTMRYLDPKADLTFKKVFGEHPDLVISLLNALLPLHMPEERIVSIEYLPAELVPETPLKKNSIVDVRCKDERGRVFLVEMQMLWSSAFMQRVLFNASKAYVRQLGDGKNTSCSSRFIPSIWSMTSFCRIWNPITTTTASWRWSILTK